MQIAIALPGAIQIAFALQRAIQIAIALLLSLKSMVCFRWIRSMGGPKTSQWMARRTPEEADIIESFMCLAFRQSLKLMFPRRP